MRGIALVLCLIAFNQAHAEDVTKMNCGGDLRCYFSESELTEALGSPQAVVANEAFLQITNDDEFQTEDESTDGDFSSLIQSASLGRGGMPGDRAPIWGSFISNFKSCAPGCVPARFGTYGRRANASCHTSGRAVDVGAIVCRGQTYPAIRGGRFAEFVSCMRGRMKTLYRNGRHVTLGHHDHAHFSNGCQVAGRTTY